MSFSGSGATAHVVGSVARRSLVRASSRVVRLSSGRAMDSCARPVAP
jgi:hypothetical protein